MRTRIVSQNSDRPGDAYFVIHVEYFLVIDCPTPIPHPKLCKDNIVIEEDYSKARE